MKEKLRELLNTWKDQEKDSQIHCRQEGMEMMMVVIIMGDSMLEDCIIDLEWILDND